MNLLEEVKYFFIFSTYSTFSGVLLAGLLYLREIYLAAYPIPEIAAIYGFVTGYFTCMLLYVLARVFVPDMVINTDK